ncbi:MAG TPA: zf-HC2 domain-containing protein, partial [Ktedonobacteraceae bacterium]|nr:zf-HC2 domain-containing protein [Ktedonobacteraceae bacterium]
MRCSKAERQLQLYIDHKLPLFQLRPLEMHLAGCAACRDELRMLETVASSLNASQTVSEPRELHEQIMQRVALSAQLSRATGRSQSKPFSPWRPSLAELLAAILLATVATLGSILEQPALRAMLPFANGHDSLSIAFLHMVHTLTSLDSSTLSLLLWIIGTAL